MLGRDPTAEPGAGPGFRSADRPQFPRRVAWPAGHGGRLGAHQPGLAAHRPGGCGQRPAGPRRLQRRGQRRHLRGPKLVQATVGADDRVTATRPQPPTGPSRRPPTPSSRACSSRWWTSGPGPAPSSPATRWPARPGRPRSRNRAGTATSPGPTWPVSWASPRRQNPVLSAIVVLNRPDPDLRRHGGCSGVLPDHELRPPPLRHPDHPGSAEPGPDTGRVHRRLAGAGHHVSGLTGRLPSSDRTGASRRFRQGRAGAPWPRPVQMTQLLARARGARDHR